MKTEKILSLALVLILFSCHKQVDDIPRLHLDTTVVTADISGGDKSISVSASGAWTAEFEEKADWVSLSAAGGDGDGNIILHFEPNVGEFRFVYLKVQLTGTDLYKMVSVNQEAVSGSPIVTLNQPQDYYPVEGGTFSLDYFSNRQPEELAVELEPDADWLDEIKIGESSISFRLHSNGEQTRRSVQMWLVHEDPAGNRFRAKCTVTQKAKEVTVDDNYDTGNESYGNDSDEINWL